MIITATVILAFAIGHLVRDGWPALGSTHLARLFGGLWCVAGATLLKPEWHGVILGAAVYVGFYYDREHGEGQRARGWIDVPPLLVSGVTSLVPLAVAADTRLGDLRMLEVAVYLAVLAVGLLKPVIWFAWWHVPVKWSADPQGLWVPTRAAAVTWGLVMAATVITIS